MKQIIINVIIQVFMMLGLAIFIKYLDDIWSVIGCFIYLVFFNVLITYKIKNEKGGK